MNAPQLSPLSGDFPIVVPDHREHFAVIGASAACFLIACALPALNFQNGYGAEQVWYGGKVFLLGWMGVLGGQFAWFANILLFGSWISLGFRWRFGAVVFAAVALLMASQCFASFGDPMPADEGGVNKLLLIKLMPGFYFWISSIVVSAVGGLFFSNRK